MKILVTGAAGFIGFHTSMRLLAEGHDVIGLDNINSYYDETLKEMRLAELCKHHRFLFVLGDLKEPQDIIPLVRGSKLDLIIHLAGQAGVRHSLEHPKSFLDDNIYATFNVLEAARQAGVGHVMLASSSSVYGDLGDHAIASEQDTPSDRPLSMYAATKKSVELMAHSYSHLHGLKVSIMRFFTVYGPWGRPDMAIWKFCKALRDGSVIEVYGDGSQVREFTYIDDIVDAIERISRLNFKGKFRVFNIGGGRKVTVKALISELSAVTGKAAEISYLKVVPGDVPATSSSTSYLSRATGWAPQWPLTQGLEEFWKWFEAYCEKRGL